MNGWEKRADKRRITWTLLERNLPRAKFDAQVCHYCRADPEEMADCAVCASTGFYWSVYIAWCVDWERETVNFHGFGTEMSSGMKRAIKAAVRAARIKLPEEILVNLEIKPSQAPALKQANKG